MKNSEIVRRIDSILLELPKSEIDIQILKRYAGSDEVISTFSKGIQMLQALRAELENE